MRTRKVFSIVIVTLATLIVLGAATISGLFFSQARDSSRENYAPPDGPQAGSPINDGLLVSMSSGSNSFLYRKNATGGASVRLTTAAKGTESNASFSHDGKLVVYSFAESPSSKSEIWVVGADGSKAHPVTGQDEDALHPAFSPDDTRIFYCASAFWGHHSPIARPARHDWDVFSVPVRQAAPLGAPASTRITHESFYGLQSLDAAADITSKPGVRLLVSTTAYPIGSLIQEFIVDGDGRNKIFQPHTPGQPAIGPSFGEARFTQDGMSILFLAASDSTSGQYDYNVYSMSDVTGSEIKQVTKLRGMTTDLRVLPHNKVTVTNSGMTHVVDISTGQESSL